MSRGRGGPVKESRYGFTINLRRSTGCVKRRIEVECSWRGSFLAKRARPLGNAMTYFRGGQIGLYATTEVEEDRPVSTMESEKR